MSDASTAAGSELAPERAVPASGRSICQPTQFIWPRLDRRGWQNAVLLVLLVLLELIATVLTPVGSTETETYWDYLFMASMGAWLAAPALLAVWAVFGPEPIAFRLPATTWLVAANYVGMMYGAWRNEDMRDSELVYFGAWVLAFAILQLPLWLLRAVRHWRLTLGPDPDAQSAAASRNVPARANGRFTLRSIFLWTLAAGVLLAVIQRLTSGAAPKLADVLAALPDAGLASLFVALGGLPVIPLAWIVLAAGRRPVLRTVLATLLLAGVAGGIPLFLYLQEAWDEWRELTMVVAGTIANSLLSLTVIRTCGYRLEQRPRSSAMDGHPLARQNELIDRVPLSGRRLAMGLAPLFLLAIALTAAVPRRLEEWRRADVIVEWERRGFQVWFEDDGQIGRLTSSGDRHISDETCRRIAGLSGLETLDLMGTKIDDRQLPPLASLPRLGSLILQNCGVTDVGLKELRRFTQLKSLNLVNTPISDAGLEHLAALSNLQSLELGITDVTDDGLRALTKLPRLAELDVALTAISEEGASEFRRACPGVELWYGASDWQVGCVLSDPTSRAVLGVPGPVREEALAPHKRLHLRGKQTLAGTVFQVTDAALVELAKEAHLEELDLRETAITDNGLLALAKIATLRQLDVRGTAVSEQGVARFAGTLPNCQIVGPK